ncbi:MAG: hypothetical protein NT150_04350 [Bacteroidetes bacterium]|nr:hypothetical protein [Bacteroidota bacterium]
MEKIIALCFCCMVMLFGCKVFKKDKCSDCPSFNKSNEKLERVEKI